MKLTPSEVEKLAELQDEIQADIEMLEEIGYCSGIENYSRHLSLREEGESPYTLLDFFGRDYLLVIDESHVTLPQVRAMYNGDRSRKMSLVDNGFRLLNINVPQNIKKQIIPIIL